MTALKAIPIVYVISQRIAAQQEISRELSSEPVETVPLASEQQYFERLNVRQTSCVMVDVAENPALELKTIATIIASRTKPIIAFSDQWQVMTAVQAIKMGAIDVIEFPITGNSLKSAISQSLAADQLSTHSIHEFIPNSILQQLSMEEGNILRLLVQGRTAKEVGTALDISVRTFHYRKKSMMQRLGLTCRADVMEMFRRTKTDVA